MRIRAARQSDARAVRRVCDACWHDDYLPNVFRDWVKDRRGRLWVAVVHERVVAVAKLTVMPSREAWRHALRVDPDHRERGIATALIEHRLTRARRLGARVARLDTSEDNTAVHRLMRRYGFRRVEVVRHYDAKPRPTARPEPARRDEIDAVWRLARGRLLHEDYTARVLTRTDVARAIRTRSCFVVRGRSGPVAVAIAERQGTVKSMRGSRLRIRMVAGRPAAMRALLVGLRGEAGAAGLERAAISPPSAQWPIARAAGYRIRWHDAMHVFEKRL